MGRALSSYLTDLSTALPQFAGIDSAAVDWATVWTRVEQRAYDAAAEEHAPGMQEPPDAEPTADVPHTDR
jgi:hypothetical protein